MSCKKRYILLSFARILHLVKDTTSFSGYTGFTCWCEVCHSLVSTTSVVLLQYFHTTNIWQSMSYTEMKGIFIFQAVFMEMQVQKLNSVYHSSSTRGATFRQEFGINRAMRWRDSVNNISWQYHAPTSMLAIKLTGLKTYAFLKMRRISLTTSCKLS